MIWMGMMIIVSSCTTEEQTAITVLCDVTDSLMTFPKAKELKPLLNLEQNYWQGVDFKLTYIADIEYEYKHTVTLPARNLVMSNQLERNQEVNFALQKVDSLLQFRQQSRDHSIVFPTVIRELNNLASNGKSTRKIMVVYSDLVENTDKVSMIEISKEEIDEQKGNELWSKLEKSYNIRPADDLSEIEVYFVYLAKDLEFSQKFSTISAIYKRQLEQRGVKVKITGNLF